MSKKYRSYFVVEGRGPFPFDMLRYDSCFPYDSESAGGLEGGYEKRGKRLVMLCHDHEFKFWAPTDGRWESFGWEVVAQSEEAGRALEFIRERKEMQS